MAANVPAAFGAYKRHAESCLRQPIRSSVWTCMYRSGAPRPPRGRYGLLAWRALEIRRQDATTDSSARRSRSSGCVAVVANYRHYPEVKMPGFMDDAAQAALWAAVHAGGIRRRSAARLS